MNRMRNKYEMDRELLIYLIIMILFFAILLLMYLHTDKKSEEMVAHAPDMTYTYEQKADEYIEMQQRIEEEQNLLEKEECLW